jgi:sugar phosphate isomerase/epimerase
MSGGIEMPSKPTAIHFGMPTLIESPSLEQSLSLCAELGLDFVEINMNLPEYQTHRLDAPAVCRMLGNAGKYITIHLDENFNVCDFNEGIADVYLRSALQTIDFAKEVNAPIINMHMADGVYFTLPEGKIYLFERYQEQYLDKLLRFRDACDKAIDGAGVAICIENCGAYHGFQRKGIDLLLESGNFALTYDVGHDFCAGNGNEAFILERAAKLRHMHVHDAIGDKNHLPLGDGAMDIQGKLALAAKYGCRCVLETKTTEGLRKSAVYIMGEKHMSRFC